MNVETPKILPLKLIDDESQYVRLQYNFCPVSVADTTVSRSLVIDESQPNVGYVDHTLQNGETARFQGNWKPQDESFKECILLFTDDEVNMVPLSGSLLKLKKA